MMYQPLKYPGGKYYLAEWIIARMPAHIHYVEPFCGGCAVLMQKPLGASEVINDIDSNVANFFSVLRDPFLSQEFLELIDTTEFGERLFEEAQAILRNTSIHNTLYRAWAFFVVNRQSRAGNMKSFTPITKTRLRGGRNNEINAWLNCIQHLPEIIARLKNVIVLNQDWRKVIESQDGPGTLFYCDPPYYPSTINGPQYAQVMSCEEHTKFLESMNCIQGKAIISGYRCKTYDEMLSNWRREDYQIANHASGAKEKRTMIESIWMNY